MLAKEFGGINSVTWGIPSISEQCSTPSRKGAHEIAETHRVRHARRPCHGRQWHCSHPAAGAGRLRHRRPGLFRQVRGLGRVGEQGRHHSRLGAHENPVHAGRQHDARPRMHFVTTGFRQWVRIQSEHHAGCLDRGKLAEGRFGRPLQPWRHGHQQSDDQCHSHQICQDHGQFQGFLLGHRFRPGFPSGRAACSGGRNGCGRCRVQRPESRRIHQGGNQQQCPVAGPGPDSRHRLHIDNAGPAEHIGRITNPDASPGRRNLSQHRPHRRHGRQQCLRGNHHDVRSGTGGSSRGRRHQPRLRRCPHQLRSRSRAIPDGLERFITSRRHHRCLQHQTGMATQEPRRDAGQTHRPRTGQPRER